MANGSPNPLADTCFTGTPPLVVSPLTTAGGNDLSVTVQLADSHPSGAYVNLTIDRGDVIPGSYCAPPDLLTAAQNSASFGLSTAVVNSTTVGHIFTDLAYTDSSGVSRQLVSVPSVVTLNPGGTAPPPPPLASFTLSPSSIAAGGESLMDVTLSRMAPAAGVNISVSSSNTSVASIIPGAQPVVLGSCTTGGGTFAVQAANSVPQQTTVTISASSGAPGQAALTQPLTVTPGCVPNTCSGGPSCGPQPDGCGGTQTCGCTNLPGQTCGGGGTPGMCGPPVVAVSALTMNPSTVTSGNSSIGTVTLNMPAPSGGSLVGISSSNSFVTVPSSITIPFNQTTGTFTANTTPFTAGVVSATISAARGDTVNSILTVNASAACTPTSCAAQGKNCGSISDGCGATLSCGSCSGTQSCGGGGVANVCGGGNTATLTLSVTGRSGTVTSTPAGLSVSQGHTASANFNIGTAIRLSTTDGRGVIWSGLCSSGGRARQSCSFTLNATGSETANQQ